MEEFIYKRRNPTVEFLDLNEPYTEARATMQVERRLGNSNANDLNELFAPRITLSPTIIDPTLTPEQIKEMSQKD